MPVIIGQARCGKRGERGARWPTTHYRALAPHQSRRTEQTSATHSLDWRNQNGGGRMCRLKTLSGDVPHFNGGDHPKSCRLKTCTHSARPCEEVDHGRCAGHGRRFGGRHGNIDKPPPPSPRRRCRNAYCPANTTDAKSAPGQIMPWRHGTAPMNASHCCICPRGIGAPTIAATPALAPRHDSMPQWIRSATGRTAGGGGLG